MLVEIKAREELNIVCIGKLRIQAPENSRMAPKRVTPTSRVLTEAPSFSQTVEYDEATKSQSQSTQTSYQPGKDATRQAAIQQAHQTR